MAKESKAEMKAVHTKVNQFKGTPNKMEKGPKSELPTGMKTPKDPGDKGSQMTSGHGGNPMSSAVAHLERETERGKHHAKVGGHAVHSHSGGYDGE